MNKRRVLYGIICFWVVVCVVFWGYKAVLGQVSVSNSDIKSVSRELKSKIRTSHEKAIKYVFKGEGAYSGLENLRLSLVKSMEYSGSVFTEDIPVCEYVSVESGAVVFESRAMVGYDVYYVMSSVYPNGNEYVRGGIIKYER